MAGKTLRVFARGTAMVPDHLAHRAGIARFIGRVWDESVKDEASGIAGGWRKVTEPTVISQDADPSVFAEHFKAVRDGDLWAADAETARMVGVPFDPHFGKAAPDAPPATQPEGPAPSSPDHGEGDVTSHE